MRSNCIVRFLIDSVVELMSNWNSAGAKYWLHTIPKGGYGLLLEARKIVQSQIKTLYLLGKHSASRAVSLALTVFNLNKLISLFS